MSYITTAHEVGHNHGSQVGYTTAPYRILGSTAAVNTLVHNTAVNTVHTHTHVHPTHARQHDPPGPCAPGGAEGNFIMFASATDGSRPNNRLFSQCSRGSMGQTIDVKGNCFVSSKC